MSWYQRYLLPRIVHLACGTKPVRKQRAKVIPLARGRVLEIGIGSGLNLPFYDAERVTKLWGLDPSPEMRRMAEQAARGAGFEVELLGLPAEEIPLEDGSVDTVVVTFTLCSIGEPEAALRQMARVLRPGGELVFCEHGAAPDARVRRWQDRVNPWWRRLGGGCNLNREIPRVIADGGYRILEMETMYIPGWRPASFNYWGTAAPARRRARGIAAAAVCSPGGSTLQAIVRHDYGLPDVLELAEIEKPEVGEDELLVEVRAASLNASDVEQLTAQPIYIRLASGFRKPRVRILGSDVAGRVVAVGSKVTRFRPGDEVLADTLYHGLGGFAEYVSIPESAPLAHKPAGLGFEEAAAIPQAGVIALQGIRDRGRVREGHQVLINGAGGGAGTFAVQLARSAGAEVTAVDRGSKLDMLRAIGADHVVDYTREDFTRRGRRYDLILDLAAHRSLRDHQRVLAPNGVYALVGGSMGAILRAVVFGPWISKTGNKRMGLLAVRPNREDLATVAELVAGGRLAAVIDRRYPLSEAAEALRCLAAGRARGKIVLTM